MSVESELKLYAALKRIRAYSSPDDLRRVAEKRYGLEGDEAIEMAYENVLQEATNALKGYRPPRAPQGAEMTELLPCPFCGDSDISVYGASDHGYMVRHTCKGDSLFTIEIARSDKPSAIAAWNRRTPPTPPTPSAAPVGEPVADDDDEFWHWLKQSYREPWQSFTVWNMQCAYRAGHDAATSQKEAVFHLRSHGDVTAEQLIELTHPNNLARAITADLATRDPVAFVDGDEVQRSLRWGDVAAFDYPVGTKLYASAPIEAQPTGWMLVPREPTIHQMAAMGPAIRACYGLDGVEGDVTGVYRAMLDAAPNHIPDTSNMVDSPHKSNTSKEPVNKPSISEHGGGERG